VFIAIAKPGESLPELAARYGVTVESVMAANRLTSTDIAPGQAILIPTNRYVVQPGDSLWRIAELSGVRLENLKRANPGANRSIYPGRPLRIPTPVKQRAKVIGYLPITDPGVTAEDLAPWAGKLTYVAVFSHLITEEGDLPPLNDGPAIRAAYEIGAKPLMSIANMEAGGAFSPELARIILTNQSVRAKVLDEVIRTMEQKGYAGVDSDIENIPRDLRQAYVDFLGELKRRLGDRPLNVAVPPKYDEYTFGYARGHDYAGIGRVADLVFIMNYEFHWVGGPPGPIAPYPQYRRVLLYAASLMPKAKILSGISTTAYDWPLPDTPENRARPWPHDEVVRIAARENATIRYNESAETPWFRYTADGTEREVWFEDARSLMAKLRTIREMDLGGLGIWHLGALNSQLISLLGDLFEVRT
jgi:spore germination protein